ncbi:polyphosphate kinase 1 [Halobaculum limi]|uniref:polyphosphate kinase 1 n=1 Tax=Halobaculum limi TaxID=3031916 RepID=UPI002405ED1A|nr:polyphosphate kinase 1 [Halobaculum sp. YSMS11]
MSSHDLSSPRLYLNRELSELAFQERVLSEGLDDRNPLLDRLRYVAYFTKNTDEFFMKRVGGLKQQIDAGVTTESPDGRTPRQQHTEVLETARPLFERQDTAWTEDLKPTLADAGIVVHDYEDLPAEPRAQLRDHFEESVLPTLTPLAFDPAHPFPFISNLSLSLAVISVSSDLDHPRFTRIKIPQNRSRFVPVPGTDHEYVLLEDLIEENIDLLLPDLDIVDVAMFKVTRNAEVRRDEEVAEDLIDMIEEVIEQRRFATVVRLEVDADISQEALSVLKEQLSVSDAEVYRREGLVDYQCLFELTDIDRPDLKAPAWTPQPHPQLGAPQGRESAEDDAVIFDRIREADRLVHHPYHTFEGTVQRFLRAAANDPDVLAVKAAIYRTASDSKVIQSLIDAADNGKQVAVMVELKARFDEQNNLEWVRRLEEEGIHVAYGTVGLKTHTKTALVVRQEEDGVRLYSHVGTGNYHSETAKGYVDLGVLTADHDIGQDLTKVFNFFTGPTLDDRFRKLLIAPVTMRERFTRYIRREAAHARAGEGGRIVVKLNGLEDPEIVEELYKASRAGVDIDLIVRDICRLRPGLEDVSETITVHSIVGRFLEHSRIFYFENAGDPEWYIGSADWMTRNLDNRVEAVAPIDSRAIRRQLRFVLEASLLDNRRRWVMNADGTYDQVSPDEGETVIDVQEVLMDATERAVRSNGPLGIDVDEALIPCDLLVEPTGETTDDRTTGGVDLTAAETNADPSANGTGSVWDNESSETIRSGDGQAAEEVSIEGGDKAPATGAVAMDGVDAADVLDRHDDQWYRPDSETYGWAVRTADGDRRYYKTRDGAAARLRAEYEADE